MLKKIMIVCFALSFVFISGIAFAGNGPGDGTGDGDGSGEYGPGDCSFTSPDSSIIIAKDQKRDRLKDDTCSPFTSPDSSIIIAGYGPGDGSGEYGPGDCG